MSIGSNIKARRVALDMTLDDVASKVGVSRQTMSRYETGVIGNIPSDKIEAIAKALSTSPAYIMGWSDEVNGTVILPKKDDVFNLPGLEDARPVEIRRYPLLGNVACGKPIFADEDIEGYIQVGVGPEADFCLRAKGDSMVGARIYDGDVVFVKKMDTVENGELAVVLIGDEATLKRVYYDKEGGVLQLFAENPNYATMRFTGEELNQIRIVGKIVTVSFNPK